MRATLIGGPFDQTEREVEEHPPDVVLCTDAGDPTLEHVYRLRGVERAGGQDVATYAYASDAATPGGP